MMSNWISISSLIYCFVDFQQMNNQICLCKSPRAALPPIKKLKKPKRLNIDLLKSINSSPRLPLENLVESRSSQALQKMVSHYQSNYLYKKLMSCPMKDIESKSNKASRMKLKTKAKSKAARASSKREDTFFRRYEDIQAASLKIKLNKLNTISYQDDSTISRNCLVKFFTPRNKQPVEQTGLKLFKSQKKQIKLAEKRNQSAYRSVELLEAPKLNRKNAGLKLLKNLEKDQKNISAWATNTIGSFEMPIK